MKEQQSDFEGYRKLIWHGKKRNHPSRRPHVRLGVYVPSPKAQTEEPPQEKAQKREKRRTLRQQH